MAIQTPTIDEIAEGIVSDIESSLNQDVPALAKTVWRVLAYGVAGAWMLLYKNGTWNLAQIFPQTASEKYLELLGENKKVIRQPAIAWEGEAQVVVPDAETYRDIEAGEQLVNTQTQVIYIVLQKVTFSGVGTYDLLVKSATTGEITDLQIGDTLTFLNATNLPSKTADVSVVSTTGADAEDLEVYRERVIDAYQKQPQGGALADYERWALETPDVINAYPYPGTKPTDVDVYIEVGDQTDGIPTQAQLDEALEYITYDPTTGRQTRKPVTDVVQTLAITRTAFEVTITGLDPDDQDTKDAIQAAVEAYFLEREPYILGLSTIRVDKITQSGVTAVAAEVASTFEATFTSLTLELASVPIASYTLGDGEKAKLDGDITFS